MTLFVLSINLERETEKQEADRQTDRQKEKERDTGRNTLGVFDTVSHCIARRR